MYDVVIQGGGPSGIACAYTSSKMGLKTLIVEKNNFLGGQMTGGLVVPVMLSESCSLNLDFYNDLILCAQKYGAQTTYVDGNDGWFNPELLKIVFDSMLKSVGVDILFETDSIYYKTLRDKKLLKEVTFKSKELSVPIESKYYVDATGDAKLSRMLGCEFLPDSDKKQPSSLRFMVSGVDMEKFESFLLSSDKNTDVTNSGHIDGKIHLTTAYTWDTSKKWGLSNIFNNAVNNGDLLPFDTAYFQLFSVSNADGAIAFNCPRLEITQGDGFFADSNALIAGRESIYRIFNFMKKYFEGFASAHISNIASITGVRVSKRVKTLYTYTLDDILTSKKFDNPVLYSNYPVDIHSNDKDASTLQMVKSYCLPVESLISCNYSNLFVIGRHLGADFASQAALRVQKSCMCMGEGLAKYLYKENIN